jgi:hypothetical protein
MRLFLARLCCELGFRFRHYATLGLSSGSFIPPLLIACCLRAADVSTNNIEHGSFHLAYGERGVFGLMNPRDGLRQRFVVIVGDDKDVARNIQRLKIELDRDGFAPGRPIQLDKSLEKISFAVEKRASDRHVTGLWFAPPVGVSYIVERNGKAVPLRSTGNWDYPLRADLDMDADRVIVRLVKTATHRR